MFEADTSNLCGSIRKKLHDYLLDNDVDVVKKIDNLNLNYNQNLVSCLS